MQNLCFLKTVVILWKFVEVSFQKRLYFTFFIKCNDWSGMVLYFLLSIQALSGLSFSSFFWRVVVQSHTWLRASIRVFIISGINATSALAQLTLSNRYLESWNISTLLWWYSLSFFTSQRDFFSKFVSFNLFEQFFSLAQQIF